MHLERRAHQKLAGFELAQPTTSLAEFSAWLASLLYGIWGSCASVLVGRSISLATSFAGRPSLYYKAIAIFRSSSRWPRRINSQPVGWPSDSLGQRYDVAIDIVLSSSILWPRDLIDQQAY